MNKFFEALVNIFRVEDLRKRLGYTLWMLAVYRIGAFIPTPGINHARFLDFFSRTASAADSSATSICSAAECCAA